MSSKELQKIANRLRLLAIDMIYKGGDGHPGPALSIAEIIAVLYFEEMNIDPANPNWEDRDRFILSKGHSCPILYAALSERGYFGEKIQDFHLRQLGSDFQGHPTMQKTKGLDMTSGSLGNGIGIGTGMGIAGKYLGKDYYVFVITGDGELQEGACWEGIHSAAANKLDNLIVFVDKNGWQSGGTVEEIIGDNNVKERFEAFGWDAQEIEGNNVDELKKAITLAKSVKEKPSVIICDDVKGKGVSYMENNNAWHKGVPSEEEYLAAMKELGGVC